MTNITPDKERVIEILKSLEADVEKISDVGGYLLNLLISEISNSISF